MTHYAPARREQMFGRIAIQGPPGSGKTPLALTLATALAGQAPVAVIDTDGRAAEYADRFTFLHTTPLEADPADLPTLVAEANHAGAGALIIDSYSLYWSGPGGALDRVDRHSDRRTGWAEYRPIEAAIRIALRTFPGHVLATLRVKTEHVPEYTATEAGDRGRATTRRLGLKPDHREGVEHDFLTVGDLDTDHVLTITKSACEDLADRRFHRPGPELADTMAAWLGQGIPVPDLRDIRAVIENPATDTATLRAIRDDPAMAGWMPAPLIDEDGNPLTLRDLINRIGKRRLAEEREAQKAAQTSTDQTNTDPAATTRQTEETP
ncbi:AAA family ATPase [Micromonospora sp. WMMD1102]|uniref:AAA family ATPase n=1 Tax=Micromonospora sp. WMMD1102 TaxID=3016105 RepID=UPI0024154332|nr:AAA family ATPase [Micromonospora sp. WMMD1102]MDG4787116.1 AAA family ATPase [Micromonospora sp. WMMD1102]